jgi:hypothetical protein
MMGEEPGYLEQFDFWFGYLGGVLTTLFSGYLAQRFGKKR